MPPEADTGWSCLQSCPAHCLPKGQTCPSLGCAAGSSPWGGCDSISWVTAGPALLLQEVPGGLPAPPYHGKYVFGPHSRLRARCSTQSTTARCLMEPGWLKAPYAPGWGNKWPLPQGWQPGICLHPVPKASLLPGELQVLKR